MAAKRRRSFQETSGSPLQPIDSGLERINDSSTQDPRRAARAYGLESLVESETCSEIGATRWPRTWTSACMHAADRAALAV